MSKNPEVSRRGFLDMQVCVPEWFSDEEVRDFAESNNPCGTTGGWQIRREGSELLRGDPERRKCSERDGFVHITLDA